MGERPRRAVPGEDLVPGWRTVEVLGGGAVTEVVLAVGRGGQAVVIKAARPGREERARASLRSEADLLGRLAAPSLPRLLAVELDAAVPHLRMEHVDGPRLSTRVRRTGPLDVGAVAALGAGLGRALSTMHAAGAAHLDVKPGNVVLGRPPRLVDLGIARTFADAARARRPIGTRRWMAPEQRDPVAFGGMGPEADVWGLGATLFLAVTGRGPFDHLAQPREPDDDGRPRKEYAVDPRAVADLRLPAHVPAGLADVVSACLTWDPDDRPRMAAVTAALGALATRGGGRESNPPGSSSPPQRL